MKPLVDADILLYKAAAATETEVQYDDDVWLISGHLSDAILHFDKAAAEIASDLRVEPKALTMCLSSSTNFRKELYPAYKSNRGSRKPVGYRELRRYVEDRYVTACIEGLEADDVMGLMQSGHTVICSIDKDLKQIPGKHYRADTKDTAFISKADADRAFWMQALHGDSTDGYAGCPGMGPVSAAKLLDGLEAGADPWPAVVAAYAKKGLGEDYALTMARIARILRPGDYDTKTKEIKLWKPT